MTFSLKIKIIHILNKKLKSFGFITISQLFYVCETIYKGVGDVK
jgi:hypothetical protein